MLAKLRPTQMALGFEEVARKRKEWRERSESDAKRFLHRHRFPAVRGPGGHHYILDHHHLGRALQEERVATVTLAVLCDLSHLGKGEFWIVMALRQWAHPFDEKGRLRPFTTMPKKLKQLADDPYRSLAAELRRAGSCRKDATPFAEFLWADFFRRRIPEKILRNHPAAALARAKSLAGKREAAHLPDWSEIGITT
ncbi:MAG TPA: ParB-like protein [Stellaceae bacterium]|nr:ParB-like protein [Stellaceae bacterium]